MNERSDNWTNLRNLLCVRLDSLGDVIMTGPALRALKEAVPDRRLSLLTSPEGADAARMMPEVDEVIVYRAPWMKAEPYGREHDQGLIQDLQRRQFDGAVIFTVYSQNPLPAAMLLYLAGIPHRAGYCRENPYHLLTHWLREREPDEIQRHEVQRQLDLAATLGATASDTRLRLNVSPDADTRAAQVLHEAGVGDSKPLIVVHPGASAPSRRYRPDLFAAAVRTLLDLRDVSVLLTGSEVEAELVHEVRTAAGLPPGTAILGEPVDVLVAVLSRAGVVVSNNTGPAHIAAAVGTPLVDLYALTNSQHFPWQVESRVLFYDVPCRWCLSSRCLYDHHACLDLVSPDEVVAAVIELLDAAPARTELAPRAGPQAG